MMDSIELESDLGQQQVQDEEVQVQNCSSLREGGNFSDYSRFCTDVAADSAYLLPWWRQLIWSILFVAMATTATCGNLIVIWIVMSHKRMRTVTNYFIVNLSIADTMVSSLNVTFNFVYMLNGHWPFGNIYCKVCSFISIISVCGSVFTLVAISADRYNAIIRPLRPRMGRPMTILVAVAIWVVAMAIAVPQLLYFTTEYDPNGDRIICFAIWPDGRMNASTTEFGYNVCFMILTYFLPMLMMTATYATIGRELWGQQAIGEATAVQVESIKSKRRVVKMMIMVVIIFGVCWLPYHTYFILSNVSPDINHSPYIQEIYLAIYWLAMSNSMYNPMIYCFMNNRFRQGFLRVYHFFVRRSVDPVADSCVLGPATNHGGGHGGNIHLKELTSAAPAGNDMRLNLNAAGGGRAGQLVTTTISTANGGSPSTTATLLLSTPKCGNSKSSSPTTNTNNGQADRQQATPAAAAATAVTLTKNSDNGGARVKSLNSDEKTFL